MNPIGYKNCLLQLHGAPEGIRTPDPLLRRQLLYPTELQAQIKQSSKKILQQ
jgi:hypothetical protein